jgi:hypothetical protein
VDACWQEYPDKSGNHNGTNCQAHLDNGLERTTLLLSPIILFQQFPGILTTNNLFQILPHSRRTSVTSRTTGSSMGITDSNNLHKQIFHDVVSKMK